MSTEQFGLIISKLVLKNFATFDDQSIKFDQGFNAIIGETGSGKSLILDAIQLILGHRADKKLIRKDCDFAIVEATFGCQDPIIKDYFHELGFPFDQDEVLIKRILYKNGKTKSFLNHQSCSLSTLTGFSKRFVDLVGQFENQKLLSENYQLQLLDNFANNHSLLKKYQTAYNSLEATRKYYNEQLAQSVAIKQKQDYLEFQLNEFNSLNISQERENELLNKKRLLQNLEENKSAIAQINHIFDGDARGFGLSSQMVQFEKLISEKLLSKDDIAAFFQAKEILTEINYKINSSSEVDFDEQEFEHVLEELDQYQKLKRKYGVQTLGLLKIQTDFQKELESIQDSDITLKKLKLKISTLEATAIELAQKIHTIRVKKSKTLSSLLTKEVQLLRMAGATIKIRLENSTKLFKNGITQIHFTAETNEGEGFYKIKDIASGGELSRILLALRTVLSSKDSISIFLFDEIDSGIGGETAKAVGKSLGAVALSSQVIAITHLPQIANFSDKLVLVSRELTTKDDRSRTISIVKEVSGAYLKKEVLSMTHLS